MAVSSERLAGRVSTELAQRPVGGGGFAAYCALVPAADDAGYRTGRILHPSGGWVSG